MDEALRKRRKKMLALAPLAIVGFALFIALGGVIVRELWNWLLPPLFGWPQVTFWQALALLALCRILFGGFRLNGHRRPGYGRRWERMTPEERERLRQNLGERCGFGAGEESQAR